MARDTEKGLEGGKRREKVLTGMPSLVKAAERQNRKNRGISNSTPGQDSSEGHQAARAGRKFFCEVEAAQAEPWELRQSQLSWEAHAKQQPSRANGGHRAIPKLLRVWVRRGERTSHQHRQQGQGLGKTARSNRQLGTRAAWQRLL